MTDQLERLEAQLDSVKESIRTGASPTPTLKSEALYLARKIVKLREGL